jgi:hypothetical protein
MKNDNETNRILYQDTTILMSKPSQNLLCVSLLKKGIPHCRLPWVFSKRKLFSDVRNNVEDDSSGYMTLAFPVF